jgi:amino acid adenylation domain-containing protein
MMLSSPTLAALFAATAARVPGRVAVDDPGQGTITYAELDLLAAQVRARLLQAGVGPGDRVGVFLHKSIDSVAAILGILKAGAAYVPVDPGSPPGRAAYILTNCAVRVALVERAMHDSLLLEVGALGMELPTIVLEAVGGGDGLRAALEGVRPDISASPARQPSDLAYILYTSGSTGRPKGVCLSHEAAISYVDWCSDVFQPTERDVFSSHAPFHFDLSILDLYVPFKHGATLVLIGEELGKDPLRLAPLIAEKRISMWYSTPSILSLLAQYGKLDRHDCSALRVVNFAGEVFPVAQLRAVTRLWPHPRYFNLYGPTETNVCTYHEIPLPVPESRTEPYPIGRCCEHLRCRVVDLDDVETRHGEEGELVVAGPGIMSGYWQLDEQNARAFLVDPDGTRWYHTGDLVVEQEDGVYLFHGRRDRMVKRRGYRIELGEIEAGLATHPQVGEVAVVALPDNEAGVRIKAWLSPRAAEKPSLIQLKQFCTEALPRYMAPDAFQFVDALPRTSTDKIDYQALKARA